MTTTETKEPMHRKPLRLWPGVVIVVLQWVARFGVPVIMPEAVMFSALGGLLGGLAIIVWWAFFSRAHWPERLAAVVLMVGSLIATSRLVHESIATAGMGVTFLILAIPVLSLAFVAWAVATRRLADTPRRAALVVTILIACGVWTLVRTDGITGDGSQDFEWRWATTPEQRLLAGTGDQPTTLSAGAAAASTGAGRIATDWPGLRGPGRDGIIPGVRIDSDWSTSPPVEIWRRKVGPGWSSFAVHSGLLYTHEQRGDDEVVACYNATTGEPVWKHHDTARFWESHAGAGPRATPALSGGLSGPARVYTFGATGILNALDAADGTLVWSRNAASDTGKKVPHWGFTSSPLVTGDVVIVDAGALAAYDLVTGEPRWQGPKGSVSYSSPHLMTLGGIEQVLLLNGAGAISVAPADGTLLWEHPWPGAGLMQPAMTADGDVLISALSSSQGIGTRRIAVAHDASLQGPDAWTTEERWTSNRLKPYFNDFVVHDGHAFGFDGRILACIDLENGERKWKGGRYGHGQLVVLPDQDLLVVLSERGELALVQAAPDRFTEVARFPALEGKTWSHPALVGDLLLVRNDQEMAAFRLALASAS